MMSRGNHPPKKKRIVFFREILLAIFADMKIYEASWGIMRPVNEMLEHAQRVTSWWSSAAGEISSQLHRWLYVTGMISNNPKTDELSRSVYCSLSVDPVLVENCWGHPQTTFFTLARIKSPSSNSIWHRRIPVGHGHLLFCHGKMGNFMAMCDFQTVKSC